MKIYFKKWQILLFLRISFIMHRAHLILLQIWINYYEMVWKCSVVYCRNRKDVQKYFKFYRLPKVKGKGNIVTISEERRRRWIDVLGIDLTSRNEETVRICSAHFISGKYVYKYLRNSPKICTFYIHISEVLNKIYILE